MSASKYPDSHKLDKISMQHKNHRTRESQPFTPCVSPVILSSSTVTNLSPATYSFPCQYHPTIVHSHLHFKKSLIKSTSAINLKTFKNSILCSVSGRLWPEATSPFLWLQNLTKRKYNFRSEYYRPA